MRTYVASYVFSEGGGSVTSKYYYFGSSGMLF